MKLAGAVRTHTVTKSPAPLAQLSGTTDWGQSAVAPKGPCAQSLPAAGFFEWSAVPHQTQPSAWFVALMEGFSLTGTFLCFY